MTGAPPPDPSSLGAPIVRDFAVRAFAHGVGARLRDGVHTMTVVIKHDDTSITAIRGRSLKYPWSTCPEAAVQLAALVGRPVSASASRAAAGIVQGTQCTHLLDLARLAIGHAGRTDRRRYRVTATNIDVEGQSVVEAWIERDGAEVLRWTVVDDQVRDPPLYRGLRIDGRAELPEACRADDCLVEAAMMLRRCLQMHRGRARRRALAANPKEIGWMVGVCFTFQPENIARARHLRSEAAAQAVE